MVLVVAVVVVVAVAAVRVGEAAEGSLVVQLGGMRAQRAVQSRARAAAQGTADGLWCRRRGTAGVRAQSTVAHSRVAVVALRPSSLFVFFSGRVNGE